MTPTAQPSVILAFDFGTRRIGLATGDTLTGTARPLKTLDCARGIPWEQIGVVIDDYRPQQFVVGLPFNMDGTPTALTEPSREFALELLGRHKIATALVDERLSSREAEAHLREARADGRKRRRVVHGDVDMVAAQILLERWFSDPSAAERVG